MTSRRGREVLRLVGVFALCVGVVFFSPWPHPGIELNSCKVAEWDEGHSTIAYLWALKLENDWTKANPKTRQELESHLKFYTTTQIEPSQSCWGRSYELEDNETMIQYGILWHAALDVVYDESWKIKRIYTSYE